MGFDDHRDLLFSSLVEEDHVGSYRGRDLRNHLKGLINLSPDGIVELVDDVPLKGDGASRDLQVKSQPHLAGSCRGTDQAFVFDLVHAQGPLPVQPVGKGVLEVLRQPDRHFFHHGLIVAQYLIKGACPLFRDQGYGFQFDIRRASVDRFQLQLQLFPGNGIGKSCHSFQVQAHAGRDDLADLLQFEFPPVPVLQPGDQAMGFHQSRDAGRWIVEIEVLQDLLEHLLDLLSSFHPGPAGVDALEDICLIGGHVALEQLQVFLFGPPGSGASESLGFVHAPAQGGDLGVRQAQVGVVNPGVHPEQVGFVHLFKFFAAAVEPPVGIEEYAPGFPGGEPRCLETLIRGQVKGLEAEHGRRGVMPVGPSGRAGIKSIDDQVWLEIPDHANHVVQHLLLLPDLQGLIRVLGIAEVIGPGEELLSSIRLACPEQLVGADDPQQLADLGADQVLPPVSPRDREVGRARVHLVREIGDHPGVLIIRVRRNVEHRTQKVELLHLVIDLA